MFSLWVVEIGAIERLQGENIVRHVGLRKAVRFVGIAGQRTADIAAVAHDGEFGIVMRGRHRDIGDAARLLAVLEADRVSELVQCRREVIIAERRERIVVSGSEPDVAAGRHVGRIISVGGRIGGRRLRDHDVGAIGPGVLDVGVGVAVDQRNGVGDGLLHLDGRRGKARRRPARCCRIVDGIIARRIREAVGNRAGPSGAAKQAVDFRIVRRADRNRSCQVRSPGRVGLYDSCFGSKHRTLELYNRLNMGLTCFNSVTTFLKGCRFVPDPEPAVAEEPR